MFSNYIIIYNSFNPPGIYVFNSIFTYRYLYIDKFDMNYYLNLSNY